MKKNRFLLPISCLALVCSCGGTIVQRSSGTPISSPIPSDTPSSTFTRIPSTSETEVISQAKDVLESQYVRTNVEAENFDLGLSFQTVGEGDALCDDFLNVEIDDLKIDLTNNKVENDYTEAEIALVSSGSLAESHSLDFSYQDSGENPETHYVHSDGSLNPTEFAAEAYMKDGVAYFDLKNKGFWSIADYFISILDDATGTDRVSKAFNAVTAILKVNRAYVDLKELIIEEDDKTTIADIIDVTTSINYDSLYDYLEESTSFIKEEDGYHYHVEAEKEDIIDFLADNIGTSDTARDIIAQLTTNLKVNACSADILVREGYVAIDYDADLSGKLSGSLNPFTTDHVLGEGEELKPIEFAFASKGKVEFTSPEEISYPAKIGTEDYGTDLTELVRAAIELLQDNEE